MMNKDFFYKFYCKIHKIAKVLIQKKKPHSFQLVNINPEDFSRHNEVKINGAYINDKEIKNELLVRKEDVFPIENIVELGSNPKLQNSYTKKNNLSLHLGVNIKNATTCWESFIEGSVISKGYKNAGFHYTGYITSNINEWCLPSWIWTNAALVRLNCNNGNINKALRIADLFLKQQLDCGGWVVRNDYTSKGAVPTLAPNDSAYIANNALIEIYKATNKIEYLEAAKRCADWIIKTARPDGLVWSGYNIKKNKWIKNHIIVDTGFTAGLFANLYDITKQNKYKIFLKTFIDQFILLFYDPVRKGFATSLNTNDKRIGGMFSRGQAWALEGLIPAYRVLKTSEIKEVIEATINSLLKEQLKNGGWAYNFSKPLLGEDCKGVSVIAKSMMEWNRIEPNDKIIISGQKALNWCVKHTANKGTHKGGVFSFCMEGSVVHNFYTKTAFVYSSAYAIELYNLLKK